MSPAPIYLLISDAESGPFTPEEILERMEPQIDFEHEQELPELAAPAVTKETLAAIEGMRDWRSVSEVLVWSWAKLLEPIHDAAFALAEQVAAGKLNTSGVRVALRDLLKPAQLWPETYEALARVVCASAEALNGWRQHSQGTDTAVLDQWPAAELFACSELKFPRDWPAAWQTAGGELYAGKMIARKDSPVWMALSDFACPFPPFSFEEGMWTRDVERDTAERLGLVGKREVMGVPTVAEPKRLVGVL